MKTLQNFFKTTVSTDWATGTGNRYITTLPTPTSGWLVVSPNNASLREIVKYTATGTDGGGNYITIATRGVGGTSDQTHSSGESVRMNITAEHWADIYVDPVFTGDVTVPTPSSGTDAANKDYVDGVAIAGAPDAGAATKGITKLSIAPASPTEPIAVGTNDTRIPTQDENDALAGTSGTPSTSNKYVTNDDTATAATASKVARRLASGDVTVPTTPTNNTDATSKVYVDSSSGAVDTTSYVLGESFTGATTPQPATVINDLHQWGMGENGTTALNWTNAADYAFGETTYEQRALKIIPRGNATIASVILQLSKAGAPSDNALVEIQTDSAGSPSGTPVTNGTSTTIAGTSLGTTAYSEITLTFSTPPSLTSGATYWVVLKRSSSLSGTDYYLTATLANSIKYGSFDAKTVDGGVWASSTLPTLQLIPATGSSLSLWKTDSDNTNWLMNQFFGWCTTTGSVGSIATLVKSGVLSGFTGLNPGIDYYTSTTAGSYTSSGGVYVGTAVSSTQMTVPKIKYGSALVGSGMFSGMLGAGSTFGTTGPRYKLPYNGTFMLSFDAAGSGLSGTIYLDNDYNTKTARYFVGIGITQDFTSTFAYTRGQYMSISVSTTSQNCTVRFNPVIE